MKTIKTLILVISIIISIPVKASLENVPGVISAPVVLYDEGSNLLSDGEYGVVIAFKDAFDSTLYSEEQLVQVRNGVALISIGNGYAVGSGYSNSAGGLEAGTFDVGTDIVVEILVEGQTIPQELTVLGSQPYAFISQKAMSVANDTVTSSQIRDGSIHSEDLDESLLDQIQNSSPVLVQSDDGQYTAIDLNASQVEVDPDIGLNNASGSSLDAVLRDLDTAIDTLRGTDLDQSVDSVNESIDTVNATIESHSDAVSGVHGVTGNIVGSSDTQSLTNKTLDSTNNIVGEAITSGAISESRIPALGQHTGASSGVHGVTGSVVGTTDSQSMQNKTLDGTNSLSGDAVKSGTVADARIAATIARDSELAFSNLSGSLSTAQFPDTLGKNISFDDVSCSGGVCKVDGIDVSSLNSQVSGISGEVATLNSQVSTNTSDISGLNTDVSAISDQMDDAVDDSRISPYLRPLAYGYLEGNSGCSSIDLVSGYNVASVTSSSSTVRISLNESLAQYSDLIILIDDVSDPGSQNDLDHKCLWGYGYLPNAVVGTNNFYIAQCSVSSDCSSINEKKLSFVVLQVPK